MEVSFYTPIDEILFQTRIVQVSGPVDSKLAHRVNKQLLALESKDPKAPIYMYINSPGGEISSGFSIFDTARFIQPTIVTVVVGLAASMGSVIALCADKKHRVAFPNSKFLIHQPLIAGVIQGPASDLEIHAKDIVKTRGKINQLYAKETGRPVEEVAKLTDRDYWMDANEAMKFGLVSRIISDRSELGASK